MVSKETHPCILLFLSGFVQTHIAISFARLKSIGFQPSHFILQILKNVNICRVKRSLLRRSTNFTGVEYGSTVSASRAGSAVPIATEACKISFMHSV